MIKLIIPHLSRAMELLSLQKKICNEWACMYGASTNIALIVDTLEKLTRSEGAIEDIYASLREFLTQLEVYQPFILDIVTQSRYREELARSLFLNSVQFEDSGCPSFVEAFNTEKQELDFFPRSLTPAISSSSTS